MESEIHNIPIEIITGKLRTTWGGGGIRDKKDCQLPLPRRASERP